MSSAAAFRRAARALVVAAVALAPGEGADAQSLDEIVAKNLEARGGVERLRAIQTVQTSGTLTTARGALPVSTWAKRPDKFRRDTKLPDRQVSMAFDGTTLRVLDTASGSSAPREIAGPEAAAAREEGNFDPLLLDYEKRGHQVTLIGTEEIGGVPVHHLRITRKGGQIEHHYLNAGTGLEMRIVATLERAGFKTELQTDLSDYRDVDGLTVAFRIEQSSKNDKATVVLDRVVFDVPIDDAIFALGK